MSKLIFFLMLFAIVASTSVAIRLYNDNAAELAAYNKAFNNLTAQLILCEGSIPQSLPPPQTKYEIDL